MFMGTDVQRVGAAAVVYPSLVLGSEGKVEEGSGRGLKDWTRDLLKET